jgi:hypothetical protein
MAAGLRLETPKDRSLTKMASRQPSTACNPAGVCGASRRSR